MSRPRNLVALIPSSLAYGLTALRGIADYCRHQHDLRLIYIDSGFTLPALGTFEPDGVIAFWTDATHAATESLGVPVLNISSGMPTLPPTSVVPDNGAIGMLAADHFMDAGFRHFAYVVLPEPTFSRERCAGFIARLEAVGHIPLPIASGTSGVDLTGLLASLGESLSVLPKPCGIFCPNDQRAGRVLEAAKIRRIRVPEEVAVIGVDNDDIFCETLDPTLTSIDANADGVGYTAARVMHEMLKGGPAPVEPLRVGSARLIERNSTTFSASGDPDVRRAVEFIRHHLSGRIDVTDVVDACATSRRTLERRFHAALGRSPAEEIERQRLARARQLLIDTDRPLSAIASECGFKYQRHLSMLFGRKLGMTPSAFRAQHRKR